MSVAELTEMLGKFKNELQYELPLGVDHFVTSSTSIKQDPFPTGEVGEEKRKFCFDKIFTSSGLAKIFAPKKNDKRRKESYSQKLADQVENKKRLICN